MDTLLLLIGVICFIYAVSLIVKSNSTNNVSCKGHKWKTMAQPGADDTYLICVVCNKTPSEIVNSVDNR